MGFVDPQKAAREAKELFSSKGIKAEDKTSMETVREAFARTYEQVHNLVPPGRYQSLMKTHLETAALFASKAFTHPE